MAAKGYTSIEDIESMLGVALSAEAEAYLTDSLMERVEGIIDSFCRRSWKTTGNQAETVYNVISGVIMPTRLTPISTIVSVTGYRGFGSSYSGELLVEGDDYEIQNPDYGVVWFRSSWTKVVIEYTQTDYIPENIALAATLLAIHYLAPHLNLDLLQGVQGVRSFKLPDLEIQFADSSIPSNRAIPPSVQSLITPYRFWVVR